MDFDELIDLCEEKKLELVFTDLGGGHGSASVYKYEEIQVREEDKDMAYLLSRCFGKRSLVFQTYYGPLTRDSVLIRLYEIVSAMYSFDTSVCHES